MARGQSIASAHVDFSAEGLPELLKGVKTAAHALSELKPPRIIDAAQAKKIADFLNKGTNANKRLAADLRDRLRKGQTEFRTSSFGGLKDALFDKRALDDGFRQYESQANKAHVIDERRKKDLKEIAGFVNRQFVGNINDPALPKGTKESVRFSGAGGTLPMRESLLDQREGFEEKRGRFRSGDIHRDPVAFLDTTIKAGNASGDLTRGSEYETFLKAMREQTVVSEGDSEAVTRVARIAEQQMSTLAGDTGAIRLSQRFQGQSDERQGRQGERESLRADSADFAMMGIEQVHAQQDGTLPEDISAELSKLADDTADNISKQRKQITGRYYDDLKQSLLYDLADGDINDRQFETRIARVGESQSRLNKRNSGVNQRTNDRANIGGMISEDVARVDAEGFLPSERLQQFSMVAKDVFDKLEIHLENALTRPYDAQREMILRNAVIEQNTHGTVDEEQLRQDLERNDRAEGRNRKRNEGLTGRALSEENIERIINDDFGQVAGIADPNEQIAQFGIFAKQVYSELEQKLETALTQPFDAQREAILRNAEIESRSHPAGTVDEEQLKQELDHVNRQESRARERDSIVSSLQSDADDIQGSGSVRVANLEREIAALEEIRRLRGGNADVDARVNEDIALKESQLPILRNLDHAESEAKGLVTQMNNLRNAGNQATPAYRALEMQLRDNIRQTAELNAATGGFNSAAHAASQGQRRYTFMMQQGSYAVQDFVQVIGQTGLSGALRASANNVAQVAATFGTMGGAIASAGITILMIGIAEAITAMGNSSEDTSKKIEKLTSRLEGLLSLQQQLQKGRVDIIKGDDTLGVSTAMGFSKTASEKDQEAKKLRQNASVGYDQVADEMAEIGLSHSLNVLSTGYQNLDNMLNNILTLGYASEAGGINDSDNSGTDTFEERIIRISLMDGQAAAKEEAARLSVNAGPQQSKKMNDLADIDSATYEGKKKLLDEMHRRLELEEKQKTQIEDMIKINEQAGQADREAAAATRLFKEAIVKAAERLKDFASGRSGQMGFGSGEANLADAERLSASLVETRANIKATEDQMKVLGPKHKDYGKLKDKRDDLQSLADQTGAGIDKFLLAGGSFGQKETQRVDAIEAKYADQLSLNAAETDPVRKAAMNKRAKERREFELDEELSSSSFSRNKRETKAEFDARILETSTKATNRFPGHVARAEISRRDIEGQRISSADASSLEGSLTGLPPLVKSMHDLDAQTELSKNQIDKWAHVLGKTPAQVAAATAAMQKWIAAQRDIARLSEAEARLKSSGQFGALEAGNTTLDSAQQAVKEERIARLKKIAEDDAAGRLTPAEKQARTAETQSQFADDMAKAIRQDKFSDLSQDASLADRLAQADGDFSIEDQRAKIRRDLEVKKAEIEANVDTGNAEQMDEARKLIAGEAMIAGVKEAALQNAPVGVSDIGSLHTQIQTSLKGDKQFDAIVEGNAILTKINNGIGALVADFSTGGRIGP